MVVLTSVPLRSKVTAEVCTASSPGLIVNWMEPEEPEPPLLQSPLNLPESSAERRRIVEQRHSTMSFMRPTVAGAAVKFNPAVYPFRF
jgi:hypothetical protein